MLQEVIITGAKASKGEYEGRFYDTTKLYIQVPFDPTNPEQAGFATVENNWGDSTNFQKIRNLNFPIKAEIEKIEVTSGRSTKNIVIDVKPIQTTQTK